MTRPPGHVITQSDQAEISLLDQMNSAHRRWLDSYEDYRCLTNPKSRAAQLDLVNQFFAEFQELYERYRQRERVPA